MYRLRLACVLTYTELQLKNSRCAHETDENERTVEQCCIAVT